MLNINQIKFETIVSDAIISAASNAKTESLAKRWVRAIEKAAELVETQSEFITWNEADQSVLILNLETSRVYEANGVCQCKAFAEGQPCKHRALAKLLKSYFAPVAPTPAEDITKAPYLKPSSDYKPQTFGGVRV